MPRHEILTQLKENSLLFSPERRQEGVDLISYYESAYNPTEALNMCLEALKGLYLLDSRNLVTDARQRYQREFDIALFEVFKALFYGMEKKYNDFSPLPELTGDVKENSKLLKEWSDANIKKINELLTSKK
jgi:hypothetical protein